MGNDESARPQPHTLEIRPESLATDRYHVVRKLGAGGMATVYEVLDRSTSKKLALKRLNADADQKRHRRILELFEREFYTLSQIAHPRVVEAYDYGIDDQGPYYTMELLQGRELQSLAPLGYADACRIGCDICSALSLLHSRRLVYRDLNPRNVHVLPDGTAKLIDFGGTTDMGPSRQVVGTPAYCAPEALDLQPLDARTDLYSLGATLYFLLTGRHAYPSKTFAQLRDFWAIRPARLSEIVADVPSGLDTLIMDLLHLDPSVRPANAGEVMEQLAAIEGRPAFELQQVTQSYLSTPNLVGRDALRARVRAKLLRAHRGSGCAIAFNGASGVGRTRLLAACLLEAKLLGALAIRADASDANEDYGVVRALASALLEGAPELGERCAAPALSLLGHALPQLTAERPGVVLQQFDDENRQRSSVLAALREWFVAIARERPLAIGVDDLHAIDEPSAAFLALCAHESAQHPLTVFATYETAATPTAPNALKLFEGAAVSLQVTNLAPHHTEELLRSVFGDVPQLQAVAHKLHAISQGNPRDTLQLAQYLVDKGVAKYRAGAWTLPAEFDAGDLPESMAGALRTQIDALDPKTRSLACLVALAGDRDLSFEECAAAFPDVPAKKVHDRLDELVAVQLLRRDGDHYRVSHSGVETGLEQALSRPEARDLHRSLALMFARRGDEELRRALHLFRADEHEAGLDVLVPYARASQAHTDSRPLEYLKLVQSLPDSWFEVYRHAIALCEKLHRPPYQVYILRNRLAGLVNVMGETSTLSHPQLLALLQQLAHTSGLTDYAALDPSLPASDRLKTAFERAGGRYHANKEGLQGLDPGTAVKYLVRTQLAAVGMAALALDYQFWSELPSLAPFAPLSPAVAIVEKLVEGVGARISGRVERAAQVYRELIDRADQPDRAGLDESNHRFMRYGVMSALAVMEAGMGFHSCLDWAQQVDAEPLHHVNALQARILYQLWQGRVRDADRMRARVELLRIESSSRQLGDGLHLVMQIVAHALSDDLTRLKHTLDEVRAFAERHSCWSPIALYGAGEYQRIRGDFTTAVAHLHAAFDLVACGTHQIWPFVAGAYISVLSQLGRNDEARKLGEQCLALAEQAGLGYLTHYVRMPLAIACAEQGEHERAVQLADQAIYGFRSLGSDGLNSMLAYETRARVAVLARDTTAYDTFAKACADQCRTAGSRVLGAKYERLVRAATTASVYVEDVAPDHVLATLTGTQLTSVLVGCNLPRERAERSLSLLLRRSGTEEGFLYLIGDHGPELVAQAGPNEPPLGLPAVVAEFIDSELQERELATRSIEDEVPAKNSLWPTPYGDKHQLVLLSHQMSEGFAVSGVAALLVKAGAPFTHPGTLASHLSRLVFDAGDVTPILG